MPHLSAFYYHGFPPRMKGWEGGGFPFFHSTALDPDHDKRGEGEGEGEAMALLRLGELMAADWSVERSIITRHFTKGVRGFLVLS